MGKLYDTITPKLQAWIQEQQLFFVATAPLAQEGHINCSPKGLDSFRVLDERTVAYIDLTGSGVETIAHLKENERITILFCALSGAPKILRLYGKGEVLPKGSESYDQLKTEFPTYDGARAIIRIHVSRIADSCGYSVPRYEYVEQRDTLLQWADRKGQQGIEDYKKEKNASSIDGLPGL
jgi:predicted pyridoxine 5'-phosphate oxidase superfamily flavin-nucleotide-binding protein